MNSKINVVIVDSCPIFRETLAQRLREDPQYSSVVATGDKNLSLFYLDRFTPGLLIIDMHLKDNGALTILRYAKKHFKDGAIVLLTDRDDSEELMHLAHTQANGYISKLIETDELLHQISMVAQKKEVVSNRLMNALSQALREDRGDITKENLLTKREKDVLQGLTEGMNNRELGRRLGVAEGTIKIHLKHILRKLQLSSRTQAALWAKEQGLKTLSNVGRKKHGQYKSRS